VSTQILSGSIGNPEAIQLGEKSPYTENLCPLSRGVELAGFCEDFAESIGELIETMLGSAVRQRTTEHLDGVLGEQQRIDDTVQTPRGEELGAFGCGARCRGCDRAR
jgi:hypothetical protein